MPRLHDGAIHAVYARHGTELYRFARRAVGDSGLAEDAVQETFLRAWRASASYDPARSSQRTWLFAILRNVVIDLARARAVRPPVTSAADVSREPSVDDELDQLLTTWQVEAALDQLAEGQRTALLEVHLRGRPYAEVAGDLGIAEGTVKSRVYYGMRALRDALEAQGWTDG